MTDDPIYENGILIADDEEIIAWAIGEFLKKKGFRNVWQVTNGRECVDFVRANGPDVALVVLDVSMPELDGPGTVLSLCEDYTGVVGVIFMTGWPARELRERWTELGNEHVRVMDFFEKPFDMDDLLTRIREKMPLVLDARRERENDAREPCRDAAGESLGD